MRRLLRSKCWIGMLAIVWCLSCESSPTSNNPPPPSDTSDVSGPDADRPCEGEGCEGCATDADCVIGDFAFQCHPEQRVCVECLQDTDCGAAGRCHPSMFQCVVCYADAHCSTGVCTSEDNFCVECLKDSHCASEHCDINTNTCLGCIADKECDDGNVCTQDSCLDSACTNTIMADGTLCEAGECTLEDVCASGECQAGPADPACDVCESDSDCDKESWCERSDGACDAPEGICTPLPSECPLSGKFTKVCGCNGKSYTSQCHAQQAGVSILHKGPCCPEFKCKTGAPIDSDNDGCVDTCGCQVSKECGAGEYCQLPTCPSESLEGKSSALGLCKSCAFSGSVCACDGKIYDNGCLAAEAGTAVASEKPENCCQPVECAAGGVPTDSTGDGCADVCLCDSDKVCGKKSVCVKTACSDEFGKCTECNTIKGAVCGCGTSTEYTDACTAAGDGVGQLTQGTCCAPLVCASGATPLFLDEDECPDACGCGSHSECFEEEYCALDDCGDDAKGMCTTCDDTAVCGCDGKQFENGCVAKALKVPVQAEGVCPAGGGACESTADCIVTEYCSFPVGDCGASGKCAPIPEKNSCPGVDDTAAAAVCGCDQLPYGNACLAAAASVSIAKQGPCDDVTNATECSTSAECEKSQYCAFPVGDCGDSGSGHCTPIPEKISCPDVDENAAAAVCGCDQKTYGNDCLAAAASTSLSKQGACDDLDKGTECNISADCGKSQFCEFELGVCSGSDDILGKCQQIPVASTCNDLPEVPVCGCDGFDYINECSAHTKKVNVEKAGPCK